MTANVSQFGRADYDSTIRVRSIPADEPRFLLRAQDEVAAEAVRLWVWLAAKRGVSPAILELALKQADAMEEWPIHKLPDAGDLTEAQVKQLTFEFDRRAHRAGVDLAPDEALKLLLAERRGYGHALSALRVMQLALHIAAKLLRGGLEERAPSNNPREEQAAALVQAVLDEIDSALLVGSRAIAQSGAQPLSEDDADWLRRHQVAMAELDGRIGRLRADQATERARFDIPPPMPRRPLRRLVLGLGVSVLGGCVWALTQVVAEAVGETPLSGAAYALGLAFTVATANFAFFFPKLPRWRISLKPPTEQLTEISGGDEAQP